MAARDFASAPSSATPLRTRAVEVPRSPSRPPPALALKYRTLFLIGRGGMGTVEAALQVLPSEAPNGQHGPRIVALKRLLPDAACDKRRVAMFLREARLAALLDHPNVVRAFDYGEAAGELYLALEYIEGQTLAQVLRALRENDVKLAPALAAHVLAEVCEGLHAAHELRDSDGQALALVHRDVSPQNVMIGYDGKVRLLDFGVAKIEAENATKTGEVKGKTAYMSPEQAMGDTIDRRSDLFGVGAVFFECLAGRRMWGEGTDMEMIRKLALERPPRLEEAVPAAVAAMSALYNRLVAALPSQRPASAREVAEALRKFVPQGTEAASRELRGVLDEHFHDRAEEQRRRLTRRLEEVAPDRARELRESVIPPLADSMAPSRPIVATEAPSAPRRRGRRVVALVAMAAATAALLWPFRPRPPPRPLAAPPAVQTAEAHATVASVTLPRASETAAAPLVATRAVPTVTTPRPSPLASIHAPAPSSVAARPSAPLAPSGTAAPPPLAKPPPDVDERPF